MDAVPLSDCARELLKRAGVPAWAAYPPFVSDPRACCATSSKPSSWVSLVLMIPVLSGGCAVDALTWALTGFGMASSQYQPDYGPKRDPPVCVEAYMAKRADGSDMLAYRRVTNKPGCQ